MTLLKTDRRHPIDRVIDYFGETSKTVTSFRQNLIAVTITVTDLPGADF